MKMLIASALVMICSFTAQGYELKFYENPVPFNPYVEDIDTLLEQAVSRNHWKFRLDEGKRLARLDYKTYQIDVELLVSSEGVTITPLSVSRTECKNRCKVDQDKVDGWLLSMRKLIALGVTKAVREDALRQIYSD